MTCEKILSEYNEILKPEDVQKILQTGRNTVYNYLAEGKIKSIKVGGKYRIPKRYLLEFIYPDYDFTKEPFLSPAAKASALSNGVTKMDIRQQLA